MMHRRHWKRLGVLALAGTLSGCGDFLTGPRLGDDDPNRPTPGATRDQLFVGMQLRTFIQQEGNLARMAGIWTQQFAGTGQQYIPFGTFEFNETDFNGDFNNNYIAAGLVAHREVIESAEAAGDRIYAGIAKIHHAMVFGTVASIWGDIPYTEAARGIANPALTPQAEVYDSVQMHLSEAIAHLQAGGGFNPGALDMVYGASGAATQIQQWIQAANTLKARYYMHWGQYAEARTAAQNGISTSANNWRTFHTSTSAEENIWHQFQRQRAGYMLAGAHLVELMEQRNDPRLPDYFSQVGGEYRGAEPGVGGSSFSNISAERDDPTYRQPIVTYAENQLILAEANYRLNDEPAARTHLNNVRTMVGQPAIDASGPALLQEILTEKYIALFQNVEVWMLYKRTCSQELTPVPGKRVPGRLYYSTDEKNVNTNIPEPTDPAYQRNANDPGLCTASVIGGA
jgi:starch-binding outer membrane protein, SusD/RagB family